MFIFVPFFFLLDLRFQLTYFSICYFYIILYFIYILVFGPKLDLKQHTWIAFSKLVEAQAGAYNSSDWNKFEL